MNKELVLAELKRMYEDETVKAKIDNSNDIDELIAVLNEQSSIKFTVDELKEVISFVGNSELTDEQLNDVSGGKYVIDDIALAFCNWLGKKVGKLFK